MDIWHAQIEYAPNSPESRQIVALSTDLIRFKKIHILQSVWTLIILFSLLVFSPLIWILLKHTLLFRPTRTARKTRGSSTDETH